jgi:hypothetical protein
MNRGAENRPISFSPIAEPASIYPLGSRQTIL